MEKAKLHSKIALCTLIVILATADIALALMFGQASWRSVAVLLTTWWLSFIVMMIGIIDSREIFGFVRSAVRHQMLSPKGYISGRLVLTLMLLAALASAIYVFGHGYVAALQYGNDFDAATAGGITLLLLALAKIFGYHRQDTKRVTTDTNDSHEYVPVGSLLS